MAPALVVWIILVAGPFGQGMTAIYPTDALCAEGGKELQELTNVLISDCVSVPVQFVANET